jgi:phosphoribosyl-AMP cyclohydrolase
MSDANTSRFASPGSKEMVEEGLEFQPRFDGDGLIPAIVTSAGSGEVLMFAWMNEQALALTIETGIGHFWSRSRQKLWKKGEESGNFLKVIEMRTDCDQDAVWVRAEVQGDGLACHTERPSCFYRSVRLGRGSADKVSLVAITPPRRR